MRILIVLGLLLCAGCSSQTALLTRQDYQTSQGEFMAGDDDDALLDLPAGVESGDFITTMENGYLSLVQGSPRISGLLKQARLEQNQVRYHVSRQGRAFFYVRTPEGYYPAEHEVIWLHLLLGWGYAQEGKYADAAAQARIADSLLTSRQHPNGHFDDPTLRVFLAGLWTMCDRWQQARVDLRSAADQAPTLGWVRDLAAREHAPAQLFIVMGGPGPDVQSDPAQASSAPRSSRKLQFVLRGRKSALSVKDAHGMVIDTRLSPDAGHWYARDLARERELAGLMQDSPYDSSKERGGARVAQLTVDGTAEGVVAGFLGGALIVAAITDQVRTHGGLLPSSYPLSDLRLPALVGGVIGGIAGAAEGADHGYRAGAAELRKTQARPNIYRYVRYLPEYLWVGWTDRPVAYPVILATPRQKIETSAAGVVNGTAVTFAHLVDAHESFCIYKNYHGSSTMVTPSQRDGSCPAQPDL